MSKEKALSFYNKGLDSEKAEEKLFCFYDAFLCLYDGKEGVAKAAESCGVSTDFLKKAVDYANADSDCERAVLTEQQLIMMQQTLKEILC